MKTIIKADIETKEEPVDFIISNDKFDNNNFVEIECEGNYYDVSLSDLYAAIKGFIEYMEQYKE
jgi:hypothetical protein